jgi:hypothetical protein
VLEDPAERCSVRLGHSSKRDGRVCLGVLATPGELLPAVTVRWLSTRSISPAEATPDGHYRGQGASGFPGLRWSVCRAARDCVGWIRRWVTSQRSVSRLRVEKCWDTSSHMAHNIAYVRRGTITQRGDLPGRPRPGERRELRRGAGRTTRFRAKAPLLPPTSLPTPDRQSEPTQRPTAPDFPEDNGHRPSLNRLPLRTPRPILMRRHYTSARNQPRRFI